MISSVIPKSDVGLIEGRIVETEAYCQNDPAAHCYDKDSPGDAKETLMNAAMFCPSGHVYVYPNSQKWCHLNIVGRDSKRQGKFGSAVLIRALEPTHNRDRMSKLRFPNDPDAGLARPWNLCSGPIKLCQALSISHDGFNKQPISQTNLSLYNRNPDEVIPVYCDRRIGVPNTWPRRYVWNGCKYLSKREYDSFECTSERLKELSALKTASEMCRFFKTN
jgi:DNA-3-methyladenine glycosylase